MKARPARFLFGVIVLLLALTGAVVRGAELQPVREDDLQKLVSLQSPAVSPDGKSTVLIVRQVVWDENKRTSDLVTVDLASGAQHTLLHDAKGLSSPVFSPDGTQIAYLATDGKADDAKTQVFAMPATGGASKALTHIDADVAGFSWSRDGRQLAFAAPDPKPKRIGADRFRDSFIFTTEPITAREFASPVHLFIKPLGDGPVTQLTSGSESLADGYPMSWSPDAMTIAVTLCPNAILNDEAYCRAMLIDVASKSARALTGRSMWEGNPLFSPDGAHIAYLYSNGDPQINLSQLYVTTPSGGPGKRISASIDRNIGDFAWSSDSASIVAAASDRLTNALYRISLDGCVQRLNIGDLVPGTPLSTTGGASIPALGSALAQDGTLVFLATAPTQPAELIKHAPDGTTSKVTNFNAFMAQFAWARTQSVTFPTTTGVTADGVLYYPPGFVSGRRYPLVVFIHGGPGDATMLEFDFWAQVMAARGWLVLRPNYRGSPNLGLKYQRAILYDPSEGPGKDIVSAVDAVRARGIVDATRIAVGGWSYGGVMTAWLISKYHFWRAAVVGASVNDWITDYGTADDSLADRDLLHGSPFVGNNAAEWRRVSAIWYAHDVTTPVLILSDIGDNRDPFATSSMYWRALRDNHKDVTLRVWPVNSHFPSDPVRVVDIYHYWIDFIAQHLR